jgi:hypothetical protein
LPPESEIGPSLQFTPSTPHGRFRGEADIQKTALKRPDNGFTYSQFRFCDFLQRCDMWGTFWRILALPDENFLVATVHSFDCWCKTVVGLIKGSSYLE